MMKINIFCAALIVVFGTINCIISLSTNNFDAAGGWFVAVLQGGCNIITNLRILNNSK